MAKWFSFEGMHTIKRFEGENLSKHWFIVPFSASTSGCSKHFSIYTN